jgi:hypothetical protein
MFALVVSPRASEIWYDRGDAVPKKVGKGLNVTVPSLLTVYVPSPGIVNEVFEQLLGLSDSLTPEVAGSSIPHSYRDAGASGEPPGLSFNSGLMVCVTS